MRRLRVSLVLAVILAGGMTSGHASVRSFDKLSLNEKMALEESERRVTVYDKELVALDRKRSQKKIAPAYYQTETQQLTELIREEALYQNAIIVPDPEVARHAREILETMEHAVLAVPVGIVYLIAIIGPQSLPALAMIH
jgi:hypothetical protein